MLGQDPSLHRGRAELTPVRRAQHAVQPMGFDLCGSGMPASTSRLVDNIRFCSQSLGSLEDHVESKTLVVPKPADCPPVIHTA